ncbi:MAG: LPS biosynthesis protein WbpP [Candidatus Rokuibacteriota bacterium]|nr:MAG: LPS biosynthesis protein WbpP [Candidatus Rokubacteria bacterium]
MRRRFLVTGGAGFIGSHLVERLLADGHHVCVLDNFSSGSLDNLAFAGPGDSLTIVRGDIRDLGCVETAAAGVEVIFHQAAMRSVPQSVADPLGTTATNVTGTLHVLEAARRQNVRRVVYASSSSVYGERPDLPKRETQVPAPISPYGVSKLAGEQYAAVWTRLYGVETVGLRYFNVFGPRQDPASEYAAVIPRFILGALEGRAVEIHGDGQQSRDFTEVENVVEANVLAADAEAAAGEVFNVGCGDRISLLEILSQLEALLARPVQRSHTEARVGDVRHSEADIDKARRLLGFAPKVEFEAGLRRAVEYFLSFSVIAPIAS